MLPGIFQSNSMEFTNFHLIVEEVLRMYPHQDQVNLKVYSTARSDKEHTAPKKIVLLHNH